MKYGSLFSGIGGFDLGFDRAGMQCAWQVEIDDFCQLVLTKHWPDVPKYKDVRDVGKHNLSPVDVVIGGFPCQPHSVAGKRRGAADDRNLWPEYLRIVAELRPTWVVGENVPGLEHTMLDTVLSDLEGEGYEVETLNIPAVAFDAPHRRERLFIVAYAQGERKHGINGNNSGTGSARNQGNAESNSDGAAVADANEHNGHRGRGDVQMGRFGSAEETQGTVYRPGDQWSVEPDVGRVAHGIPDRVDRLKALGNAVVPQVAQFIGEQIMAVEEMYQ